MPLHRIPAVVEQVPPLVEKLDKAGEHVTYVLPWSGEFLIFTTKPKAVTPAAQRETRGTR